MKLKAIFSRKRICARCGERIKQTHRWKQRHIRLLFWVLTVPEHRSCHHPHMNPTNPYAVKRLKGERPFPVDTPDGDRVTSA
jgi:hypothetical protein